MRKNLDTKGRYRSVTTAFRMSKAESDLLNTKVKLSGLSKQEYILNRCFEKDIVVVGSPRIYKALQSELRKVLDELKRISKGNFIDSDLLNVIEIISITLDGMKNKNSYPKG